MKRFQVKASQNRRHANHHPIPRAPCFSPAIIPRAEKTESDPENCLSMPDDIKKTLWATDLRQRLCASQTIQVHLAQALVESVAG
jgi:peptide deformylase